MGRKRKKSCPICHKRVSRKRPRLDAGILTLGGWQKRCPFCRSLLFIPLDEAKSIEATVAPFTEIPAFGLGTIFDEEIKLLEAIAEGGK